VENPKHFYRFVAFGRCLSSAWQKSNQKKTPVSRFILRVVQPADDAAPRAVMRRCRTPSGAHNLTIAALLELSAALPADAMLAASAGCSGWSTRKRASLRPA
jgi:hypothetical protein